MNTPKRHHWWPELQSRYWTDSGGLIYVTRKDGTFFHTTPENVGVEGQLYSRYTDTGSSDPTIERWFSSNIEGPFTECLQHILTLPGLRREPFKSDPEKLQTAKELGFIAKDFRETIHLPEKYRTALSHYLAALVVRSPQYLERLRTFHKTIDKEASTRKTKTAALDDMLNLFELYKTEIANSTVMFTKREGDSEFLFSDGGISPEEPWRPGPIPFDIFAPLTPDLAVTVLRSPAGDFAVNNRCILGRVTTQGVSRLNRKIIGTGNKFVFSRNFPPISFIRKFFGKPAPKSIGVRWNKGRVEVKYDREKDTS